MNEIDETRGKEMIMQNWISTKTKVKQGTHHAYDVSAACQRMEGFARTPGRSSAGVLLVCAILCTSGIVNAQSLEWDADGVAGAPSGGTGDWNTTATFWNDGGVMSAWNNAADDIAGFSGTAGTVTLTEGITLNGMIFDTAGYLLAGNTLNFSGTAPTITANANSTVNSAIAGLALRKNGSARLTLGGGMILTEGMTLTDGITTFTGSVDYVAGTAAPLLAGSGSGSRAILELHSSGTVSLGDNVASAYFRMGSGAGAAGCVVHTSGDVRIGSANSYSYLDVGFNGSFGYYRIDGGTVAAGTGGGRLGLTVGNGGDGLGVYEQTGGEVTFTRYVVLGNGSGADTRGEVTLTGGTFNQANAAGNYVLVGDDSHGQLNLGTLAGGDALMTSSAHVKLGEADNAANG